MDGIELFKYINKICKHYRGGIMKRAKKPKKKLITMTTKQLEKLKDEVRQDCLDKYTLLILAAAVNTVKITDDDLCLIAKRTNRYADYIDEHLAQMKDIQNTIEKGTGVKLKGWS